MSGRNPEATLLRALGSLANGDRNGFQKAVAEMSAAGDSVYNPGVVRTGDQIVLPEGADIEDVINALENQRDSEQQFVQFLVDIPVSPWDGAHALKQALQSELGIVIHKGCRAGCCPPRQIDVEVDFGKSVSIPWGRFSLPNMADATIATGSTIQDGRLVFQCDVNCQRLYEARLRRLLDKIKEIATKESLHRGKAFSIAFHDEAGGKIEMPAPKFFQLTPERPIFSQELERAIERNVFVPIRHADQLIAAGESLKRGVAFVGNYGVGKTLLASHVARAATANGWTFIYVKNPIELQEALRYAQQYQPVVVFVEDIRSHCRSGTNQRGQRALEPA